MTELNTILPLKDLLDYFNFNTNHLSSDQMTNIKHILSQIAKTTVDILKSANTDTYIQIMESELSLSQSQGNKTLNDIKESLTVFEDSPKEHESLQEHSKNNLLLKRGSLFNFIYSILVFNNFFVLFFDRKNCWFSGIQQSFL